MALGRRINITGYAVTIFASAFLLFQIQPIIAKVILPWFGGSAEVWTICMLFFQSALLLGYLYAHLLVRLLSPRWQVLVHAALLASSLIWLGILPDASWKPAASGDPAIQILLLLTRTVGLPYFLLSATSPLLQTWLAELRPGTIPYRLFALSNAGSMLALLSYPVLVEPAIASKAQASAWSAAYTAFALVCGAVAFSSLSGGRPAASLKNDGLRPPLRRRFVWLSLAACASTLLLAITTHLTQNVAAVPFLWVAPLALYLLSFVFCFESERWYKRRIWFPLTAVALGCMAYAIRGEGQPLPIRIALSLFCGGLFACCMTMHGELARLRPEARYLTTFYLTCSLGGATGGVFVGVLAPHLFNRHSELPIALVWCAFLIYAVMDLDKSAPPGKSLWNPLWAAPILEAVVLAFYLAPNLTAPVAGSGLALRNFYGALRVWESKNVRQLRNGVIIHGEQLLDPARRRHATTYYGENSGVGRVLRETGVRPGLRVGVIGLGVGTVASYAKPGDYFRFYELNPLVIQVAATHFTYLKESSAKIDLVPGDARLSLEREPPQNFDVLVVDAFNGDAIPVHLLTREAFGVYFRHLKDDGVVAVHISNSHVDLRPVIRSAADAFSRRALLIESAGDADRRTMLAEWALIGRPEILDRPLLRSAGNPIARKDRMRMWTDDYNNVLQVLR